MGNSIALAKKYVPLLDEVYKNAALTADLDGAAELVQQGANANELIIPKMSMDGLADYSRNGGYVSGDVTLTNETVQCNFDRGRMFQVDAMDNEETAGIAFGRLAGEFIRTKVAPEVDAFRLAAYASASGISYARMHGWPESCLAMPTVMGASSTKTETMSLPLRAASLIMSRQAMSERRLLPHLNHIRKTLKMPVKSETPLKRKKLRRMTEQKTKKPKVRTDPWGPSQRGFGWRGSGWSFWLL